MTLPVMNSMPLVFETKIKCPRAKYFCSQNMTEKVHREGYIIIAVSLLDAPTTAISWIFIAVVIAIFFDESCSREQGFARDLTCNASPFFFGWPSLL